MAYATTNPYTGEVVQTFADATDAEVASALDRAQSSFQTWRRADLDKRCAVLRKAAEILRQRGDDCARLLTLEMGKVLGEAKAEVELSAKILDYYADNARDLLAPAKLKSKHPSHGPCWVEHEPLGIVLAIEPWNFPYYQIVRIAAPQLAAGNVIVLKHASNVPQCAAAFEDI